MLGEKQTEPVILGEQLAISIVVKVISKGDDQPNPEELTRKKKHTLP
jgi:hypothetical protein